MLRKAFLMAALAAGLASAPGWLEAQTVRSPYRFIDGKHDFGPYVAYIFADAGEAGLGAMSGYAFGGQFAIRVSDPIQVAANVSYFPTEREVQDPSTGEPTPQPVGTTPLNLLMISGRLQFNLTGNRTWHRLAPYVIGGLGVAIDITSNPVCVSGSDQPDCQISAPERFNFGTSFLGQAGVGTAIIISDHIGARVTFEDDIWKLTTPGGWFFAGVDLDPFPPDTDWTNNWQLSLVLSYWF